MIAHTRSRTIKRQILLHNGPCSRDDLIDFAAYSIAVRVERKNAFDQGADIQPFVLGVLETAVIKIVAVDVHARSERVTVTLLHVVFGGPCNAKTALRRLLRPVANPFLSGRSDREVEYIQSQTDAPVNLRHPWKQWVSTLLPDALLTSRHHRHVLCNKTNISGIFLEHSDALCEQTRACIERCKVTCISPKDFAREVTSWSLRACNVGASTRTRYGQHDRDHQCQ